MQSCLESTCRFRHMRAKHQAKGSLHPNHFLRLLLGLGGSGALADPPWTSAPASAIFSRASRKIMRSRTCKSLQLCSCFCTWGVLIDLFRADTMWVSTAKPDVALDPKCGQCRSPGAQGVVANTVESEICYCFVHF